MKLQRLFRRRSPGLSALPSPQPFDSCPLAHARLVVVDLETTGLDIHRDEILSIGAVAIENGALHLGDQFECTIYRPHLRANEATVLHEISPQQMRGGEQAAVALHDFLIWADTCVMVAFHAGFEQRMLARSARDELGLRLEHRYLDVAEMAPMLFPEAQDCRSLDDWQRHFGLVNSERHNAAADAQVTAEILLILLHRLTREGTRSLAELNNRLSMWRRLHRGRASRF